MCSICGFSCQEYFNFMSSWGQFIQIILGDPRKIGNKSSSYLHSSMCVRSKIPTERQASQSCNWPPQISPKGVLLIASFEENILPFFIRSLRMFYCSLCRVYGTDSSDSINFCYTQLPTDRRRVRTPPVVSICGVCTRIYICSVWTPPWGIYNISSSTLYIRQWTNAQPVHCVKQVNRYFSLFPIPFHPRLIPLPLAE
jgi:hypothetical protein